MSLEYLQERKNNKITLKKDKSTIKQYKTNSVYTS